MRSDAVAYKLSHGDLAWGSSGWKAAAALTHIRTGHVRLIEVDGISAAMMMLSWQDETYWGKQGPDAGYLHGLAVRRDFRGLGLGAFALRWANDHVASHGRRYLRLDCDARNTKLCAYYESFGFERVRTRAIHGLGDYVAALYQTVAQARTPG
jgi:ribosomal protein S18 acetylase RimI-like enzyme